MFNRLGFIHLSEAYKLKDTNPCPDKLINPISHMNEMKSADESLALISKDMYLKACQLNPTSDSWLGAGRACFALGKYDEAEDAFAVLKVISLKK